jgi:hypothetical protein
MKTKLYIFVCILAFSFTNCSKETKELFIPEDDDTTQPTDTIPNPDTNTSANNLGTTVLNNLKVYDGYTLFTSHKNTYLIDNCGSLIHEWNSTYLPGNSVYLLDDGSILRAGKIDNPDLDYAGIGGIVEIINWDNEVTWSYQFSTETFTQHHDVFPMPNGNILVLIAEKKTNQEVLDSGRNPELLSETNLYNEYIIEVTPIGTSEINEVWKWSYWDHLVQNFDETKKNFSSSIKDPYKLDLNFLSQANNTDIDWLHVNYIKYNERLDQILISAQGINELHIIDHSTTTAQAQTDTGGRSGKGGDFIYRYGNTAAYGEGDLTDLKLFRQHYPNWVLDTNKIILYNNGNGRPEGAYSTVDIINPPITSNGEYTLTNNTYGPLNLDWTYIDPVDPINFYSRILSGAQALPNGNFLVCEGLTGRFFEVTPEKETVWQYISPVQSSGTILRDDQEPEGNLTFRAIKYAVTHPAFTNKDLNSKGPIELNASAFNCNN